MSLVDLSAFPFPSSAATAISLSEIGQPITAAEAAETQTILREVASLLSRTPGAAGSMRRRLGIVVDCLIAVADEIDGDPEAEATAPERFGGGFDGAGHGEDDEGAQCDDEGQHDDNGIADFDGEAEQWGHQHRQGGWVLG